MATLHAKPKTVLLLIETLNRGGIENVLLRLIPKLKEQGWTGVVVTIRDGGEMLREYEDAGIKVIPLKQRFFLSPKTLALIYRECRILDPDIIVTTLFKADVIGRLFLRFVLPQPIVPYLVTTYNHPRYWIARVFEWFTKPFATHYIANSEAVKVFYQERLGVPARKIVIAPNGVDTQAFQTASGEAIQDELRLPKEAFVVTCVANLAPNKGQADLLRAFDTVFTAHPEAVLLLVGDGEERAALTAERDTLTTKDRIYLLGRRRDVPAILQSTTIFVLPTLFEGMSTALLEAMAAGKAIITTDIPENKVLLTHRHSALLVKPKDREGLAQSLQELYRDTILRQEVAQAALAEVEKNYSITQMAHMFGVIFNTLVPRPSRPCVVHVIGTLESGGAENMLLKILPIVNQGDFEHIVITLFRPGELSSRFEKAGIKTVNIGLKSLADIHSLQHLTQTISRLRPALVITYLFHASLIGRLYVQPRIKAPVIPFLRSTYNFPRYLPARLFERLTKKWVTRYFANSEAVKAYYVSHIGVRAEKITVIHNGIDVALYNKLDHHNITQVLRLPSPRLTITCVANLAVNKGHAYLLEAFESIFDDFPQAFLLIVGEGHERDYLEHQITSYKAKDHIFFLGRRDNVPSILALTDIFVLPTLFEGLSNAILEAMAARCAVVTTDIPENRVMITHNKTGLLVPSRDVASLAQAMTRLLHDKPLRDTLGQAAHDFIKTHFNLYQIAQELDLAIQTYAKIDE